MDTNENDIETIIASSSDSESGKYPSKKDSRRHHKSNINFSS